MGSPSFCPFTCLADPAGHQEARSLLSAEGSGVDQEGSRASTEAGGLRFTQILDREDGKIIATDPKYLGSVSDAAFVVSQRLDSPTFREESACRTSALESC